MRAVCAGDPDAGRGRALSGDVGKAPLDVARMGAAAARNGGYQKRREDRSAHGVGMIEEISVLVAVVLNDGAVEA